MYKKIIPALALATALTTTATAKDSTFTAAQTDAIKKIVEDTLLENPDIVFKAIAEQRKKSESAKAEKTKAGIATFQKEFADYKTKPTLGNVKGDVVIAEFLDYNCGYCRRVAATLQDVVKADKNVRVVYLDFPIRGAGAVYASKAAIAAHQQGKYQELHDAMMTYKGTMDEKTVNELAQKVGLNLVKLQKAMNSAAVLDHLKQVEKWARLVQIDGTPSMIIGDTFVPGAVPQDAMEKIITEQRAKK